jgi:hypothetical protein
MGKVERLAGGSLLLVAIVVAFGCGGNGATGTSSAETAERPYPNIEGKAREFLIPGGDNTVQVFGEEATTGEREAASKVIHLWMKARVAEDWPADCRYLSRAYSKTLVKDAHEVTEGKVTTCPEALDYFGPNASGTSGNTLTGSIDSLRVKAPRAYAQWHGPDEDWVLPVRLEDEQWKVESASPIERTK